MVVVRPGDWLWLSAPASSSFNVPIGCKVESVGKSKVIVVDDEGQKHTFDMVKAASRNQFAYNLKAINYSMDHKIRIFSCERD